MSSESHNSNGRIESVIRTIRDAMLKDKREFSTEKLYETIYTYNSTLHSGIGMSPQETFHNELDILIRNSQYSKHAVTFKETKREKFKIRQKVAISKRENLGSASKFATGRFLADGVVVEMMNND